MLEYADASLRQGLRSQAREVFYAVARRSAPGASPQQLQIGLYALQGDRTTVAPGVILTQYNSAESIELPPQTPVGIELAQRAEPSFGPISIAAVDSPAILT